MIIFRSLPSITLEISSKFGMRVHPITGEKKMHQGVDIKPSIEKAPVLAVMCGKICENYWNSARGWVVIIDHGMIGGKKAKTLYQHLREKSSLETGSSVLSGQNIGIMGTTGSSTGIHLHFELIVDNTPIDPEPYLNRFKNNLAGFTNCHLISCL